MNIEPEPDHFPDLSLLKFPSVVALFAHYGFLCKARDNWRLTVPTEGEIFGLPTSHGTLLATDGIECFIIQPHKPEPFIGHFDFFVKDPRLPASAHIECLDGTKVPISNMSKEVKQTKISEELLETLLNL